MSLNDLLKQNLVEKFESSAEQVAIEVDNARKKMTSAKNVLQIGEWGLAYVTAYNAMLHAGRALMFSKGYRAKGHDHHVAVVSFVQVVFSSKFSNDVLGFFGKARKLRNEFTYDSADLV